MFQSFLAHGYIDVVDVSNVSFQKRYENHHPSTYRSTNDDQNDQFAET